MTLMNKVRSALTFHIVRFLYFIRKREPLAPVSRKTAPGSEIPLETGPAAPGGQPGPGLFGGYCFSGTTSHLPRASIDITQSAPSAQTPVCGAWFVRAK